MYIESNNITKTKDGRNARNISIIWVLILVCALLFAAPYSAFAQGDADLDDNTVQTDEDSSGSDTEDSEDISLTFSSAPSSMNVGDKTTIAYDIEGTTSSVTVKWTSSNPDVASVSSKGEVTAKSAGAVEIIAEAPSLGLRTSAMIRVNDIQPASITIGAKELTTEDMLLSTHDIVIGDKLHLTANVEPANTTNMPTMEWSSSDPSILTVDATGVVTAVAEGEAIVTVRAGQLSDRIDFNVTPPPSTGIGKYLLAGFALIVAIIIIFIIVMIVRRSRRKRRESEIEEARTYAADELKNKIKTQNANKKKRTETIPQGEVIDRKTRIFIPPENGIDAREELDTALNDVNDVNDVMDDPLLDVSNDELDAADDFAEDGPDRPFSLDDID